MTDPTGRETATCRRSPALTAMGVALAWAVVLGAGAGGFGSDSGPAEDNGQTAPLEAGGEPDDAGQEESGRRMEPFDLPPLPHSRMALAEPVVGADVSLAAQRATTWLEEGPVRFLLLEHDVRFELGAYGFEAARAVARIVIERQPGRTVHHVALYLEEAQSLRGHGAVMAEGERLLVTGSTTGVITLDTDLLEPTEPPDTAPAGEFVESAIRRMLRRDALLAQWTLPVPDEPIYGPEVWRRREAQRHRVELPMILRGESVPPLDFDAGEDALPEPEPIPAPDVDETPAPPPLPSSDDSEASGATGMSPRVEPGLALSTAPSSLGTLGSPSPFPADTAASSDEADDADTEAHVLPVAGTVRYAADRVIFQPEEEESHLILIGNVRLFYDDRDAERQVTLQTERAVVFLSPSEDHGQAQAPAPPERQLEAGAVRGIYLEDNAIITDGRYTVRAPRIFYDLSLNQAVLLEAVAFTYDVRQRIPIYVRADMVRQTSRHSFEARGALVTTSSFAEPHFAIGARRLTFHQRETPEGEPRNWVTARDTTFRVGPVPVFYWPYIAAPAEVPPIRSVSTGYSSRTGVEVQTRWDPFALIGRTPPAHMDAALDLDYRGEHNFGLGLDAEYDPQGIAGGLEGYILPYDTGTDRIADRDEIGHDGDTRGYVRWRHRHELPEDWDLRLEAAYVSDETFLEEFFRSEAAEARPYETSFYLNKREQQWQIDLLANTYLSDFTPQTAPLQSPGYRVEKLPELGYYHTGTSFLGNRLSWYSENSFSRVRADFGNAAPIDYGFTERASQELFGIERETTFRDAATADGFPDDWRLRLDTRQEVTAPIRAGKLDVTPYIVGRATLYDDDFQDYAGEADDYRLVGSVGARLATQFNRTYNARSRILDIDGLRHIVEPGVDVFFIESSVDTNALPVFDPDIEAIAEGQGARFGLTNTFQTRRGGAERWRSVDWIVLQTDVILRSSDGDVDAPLPRHYAFRPELSRGGDHFHTRLLWMVSDTLGVTGELTHNMENDRLAQWRLAANLDHTPRLNSYASYSELDALDSRLLSYGFGYDLTAKYDLSFRHQIDFGENESRRVRVTLERILPQARLQIFADFDQIEDEQMVGVVFVPEGVGRGTDTAFFDR